MKDKNLDKLRLDIEEAHACLFKVNEFLNRLYKELNEMQQEK